jgi:hypothetical protein
MRDAWAKLSITPLGSFLHFLFKRKLERSCFSQAKVITTVTPQLLVQFKKTHPNIPEKKFNLIYNAFNFKLQDKINVSSSSIGEKQILKIGYIGSYYYTPNKFQSEKNVWWNILNHKRFQYFPVKEDWLYRSPFYFFQVLQMVFNSKPEWKNNIFFHHIGEIPFWLEEMIEEFGLGNNVVLHGLQSLENTLQIQNSFDYLLATSEKVIGDEHYCLPSKLFTYLKTNKPILAFVTNGIQKDFIEKSNSGVIFDPDLIEESSRTFVRLIETGVNLDVNVKYLQNFSNEITSSKFVEIIRNVIILKDL